MDPDLCRGPAVCIEIGAKQNIPEHQVLTVILVALIEIKRVMPTMHARCVEHIVERSCARLNITMGQNTHKGREGADP